MYSFFTRARRTLALSLLALCWALFGSLAQANPAWLGKSGASAAQAGTEQVQAELLLYAPQGVGAGKSLWLGVLLKHAPHWHTYWQNPGDSGLPTELDWTLPAGWQAQALLWPKPQAIAVGPLTNLGYEGQALLVTPVKITQDLQQAAQIQVKARWLACKEECIPQEASLSLKLAPDQIKPQHTALFERALAEQPLPLAESGLVRITADGQLALQVRGIQSTASTLSALPMSAQVVALSPAIGLRPQDQQWEAVAQISSERSSAPTTLSWLVLNPEAKAGQPMGWVASTPVEGTWPALAQLGVSPALQAAIDANAARASSPGAAPASADALTFVLALLGAVLGGLILNLMPCVFPVLALKVLHLQHSASTLADDPRAHRSEGLFYTFGVISCFAALGVLLMVLRASGEQLGWGFQLQNPYFVGALALLFAAMGLNMLGLFEFSHWVPSSLAAKQWQNRNANAWLSGALAVLVASPCTAPFMGSALGVALQWPAWQGLLLFISLGLGLALPFLLLSFIPQWARWLPRPGPWMNTLRRVLAIPMLATVAWLLWILGLQTGLLSPSVEETPVSQAAGAGVQAKNTWQPWSPQAVQQALAENKTVFVDFTAAWCITCQANKKLVLQQDDVIAHMDAHGVVRLRADWTRRDSAISAALTELGRSGVPVYVVHKPGQAPVVLPEVLSKALVMEALGR